MSNGNGGDVRADISTDVAFYDSLPSAVRCAIQNAAVPVSCAQADDLLDEYSESDVVKMIDRTGRALNLYAHCFRSGEIEFSEEPERDGMICLGTGAAPELSQIVTVLARHGYQRGVLIVPGIPEANSDDEAYDAMIQFKNNIALRLAA